jgi:transcriptional regulator with XRE-family HTH domain
MTIGEKIKMLREEQELTHVDLAKKLDCSIGLISLWENNLRKPNADSLIALAKFFGVSADYLLGISDD